MIGKALSGELSVWVQVLLDHPEFRYANRGDCDQIAQSDLSDSCLRI